jgi:hypothetical protein
MTEDNSERLLLITQGHFRDLVRDVADVAARKAVAIAFTTRELVTEDEALREIIHYMPVLTNYIVEKMDDFIDFVGQPALTLKPKPYQEGEEQ